MGGTVPATRNRDEGRDREPAFRSPDAPAVPTRMSRSPRLFWFQRRPRKRRPKRVPKRPRSTSNSGRGAGWQPTRSETLAADCADRGTCRRFGIPLLRPWEFRTCLSAAPMQNSAVQNSAPPSDPRRQASGSLHFRKWSCATPKPPTAGWPARRPIRRISLRTG